ncbi:TolC family protein [Phenylobacterium sp.]|uniref:TolC family protein n=1 Tax=Phenylobacterium sp. TaxID=1871053 RepID=UPI0035AE5AD4
MASRVHILRVAPALGALLLAGCMGTGALERAPAAPDQPWRPATGPGGEILAGPQAREGEPGAEQGYVLPENAAAGALPALPAIDPAREYGLADLIDLAEAQSPDTRIAWNQARNAALAAGLARSVFLPSLAATALGAWQTSHGNVSALGLGGGDDGSADGRLGAVSLQWLLFDFGERAADARAADQDVVIADIRFTAAHQELIHSVALAYYAYAAARARVATTEQSMADARAVEAAADARYAHGVGTVIEVAQARQATAQARLAQVRADGAERDGYVRLMLAMGVSPLAKIRIAPMPDRPLSPDLEAPVEDLLSAALARRPDVLAAYAAEKAATAREAAAEAERWPKLFASGSAATASGDASLTAIPAIGDQSPTLNLSGGRHGTSIIAGVTAPLFDGGRRRTLHDQARIRADTARLTLDRVKQQALDQILMSRNALHTALETYSAAQALLTAAQTTYDASLAAYRNEVGSSTDVVAAERQLLEARDLTTDARSAALSAAATLALAAGTLGSAP